MKRLFAFALWCIATTGALADTAPSYEGLWWNEPANSQSGWGINVAHQGGVIFATWFTYDEDGKPLWLVMPDLQVTSSPGETGITFPYYNNGAVPSQVIFTGQIYRTSGPYWAAFNPALVGSTPVGLGTLTFFDANFATFSVLMNGSSMSIDHEITKEVFAALPTCEFGATPPATPNFTDLWWRSSESGWGVNVVEQGNILFATWFTYDSTGRDVWYVMPGSSQTGAMSWSGTLYSTTGPAFDGNWDASKVTATAVGNASFAFTDANDGTFTVTLDGQTVSKPITRQVFGLPQTVCH